jgi:hypothetical protein
LDFHLEWLFGGLGVDFDLGPKAQSLVEISKATTQKKGLKSPKIHQQPTTSFPAKFSFDRTCSSNPTFSFNFDVT